MSPHESARVISLFLRGVIASALCACAWAGAADAQLAQGAVPHPILPQGERGNNSPLEELQAAQTALAARLAPSIAAVECRAGPRHERYYGTAVVISRGGVLLTSVTAVPPGAQDVRLCFSDGAELGASVAFWDMQTEAVVLQPHLPHLRAWHPVPLGRARYLSLGDPLYAVGNAHETLRRDGQVFFSAGAFTGRYEASSADESSRYQGEVLETSAAVNPGCDGGALVNGRGQLVGLLTLCVARSRWLGTAVPIERVLAALPKVFRPAEEAEGGDEGLTTSGQDPSPYPSRRDVPLPQGARGTNGEAAPGPRDALAEALRCASFRAATAVVSLRVERGGEPAAFPERSEPCQAAPVEHHSAVPSVMARRPDGPLTGVLVEPRGTVLTSALNLAGAREIVHVRLSDGRSYRARRQGSHADLDVAVLALEGLGDEPLPTLTLAPEACLRAGSFVAALGAPPRERGEVTATFGIVSALGRVEDLAIQMDARANYGNAGGPVVDLQGRLVGIVSQVGPRRIWAQSSGVSFLAPAPCVLAVLDELRAGRVLRNPGSESLGVAPAVGETVLEGVKLAHVLEGSPAWKAGLREADLITAFDGQPTRSWAALMGLLKARQPGREFVVQGVRGIEPFQVPVVPAMPEPVQHRDTENTENCSGVKKDREDTDAVLRVLCASVVKNTRGVAEQLEAELASTIAKALPAFVFVAGGAGVCVSPDGYILTNYHVVSRRERWSVRVYGTGRIHEAEVVGRDECGDVALLKIPDARDLPWAPLADPAAMRLGQWVLALGDPYKLGDMDGPPSVSLGSLSALHRYQGDPLAPRAGFYADALQTDAAVNPGNSGGPLLNMRGELLGLTGQIMARFGGKANSGVAYVVSCAQLARFLPLLKAAGGGRVEHGTLPAGLHLAWQGGLEDGASRAAGAHVAAIVHDSPAARAGFRAGDRIVNVAGEPVCGPYRLLGVVQSWPEQTELEYQVRRGAKEVSLRVVSPRLELCPAR